jgi:hypothetical protein
VTVGACLRREGEGEVVREEEYVSEKKMRAPSRFNFHSVERATTTTITRKTRRGKKGF